MVLGEEWALGAQRFGPCVASRNMNIRDIKGVGKSVRNC